MFTEGYSLYSGGGEFAGGGDSAEIFQALGLEDKVSWFSRETPVYLWMGGARRIFIGKKGNYYAGPN